MLHAALLAIPLLLLATAYIAYRGSDSSMAMEPASAVLLSKPVPEPYHPHEFQAYFGMLAEGDETGFVQKVEAGRSACIEHARAYPDHRQDHFLGCLKQLLGPENIVVLSPEEFRALERQHHGYEPV